MESISKLGEVQMEMTSDVKMSEELKVLLRWGWGAETTGKLAFKPSEDLKVGDGIKVTIEKVVVTPDPVEEKIEDIVAETEERQEPVAEAECPAGAGEKTEPVTECECTCTCENDDKCETVAVEMERTAEAIDDTKTI